MRGGERRGEGKREERGLLHFILSSSSRTIRPYRVISLLLVVVIRAKGKRRRERQKGKREKKRKIK